MKNLTVLLIIYSVSNFIASGCFSFEEDILVAIVDQKRQEVLAEVNQEHQEMFRIQSSLYQGLKSFDLPHHPESSRASSHSGKSVCQNWESINLALGSLIVVKESGEIIKIPVSHPDHLEISTAIGEGRTIYDSCHDRTHNIIPSPEQCEAQWKRYRRNYDGSRFCAGWGRIKQGINTSRERVSATINQIKEALEEKRWGDIVRDIEAFQNLSFAPNAIPREARGLNWLVDTWIHSGWHSEQRLIFDLDQDDMIRKINGIEGIAAIVACVHTRIFPCVDDDKPSNKNNSCSCYHCLKNWPNRWVRFSPPYKRLPIILTVSYQDDKHSIKAPIDESNRQVFFHQFKEQDHEPSIEHAEKWVQSAQLNRQICFARRDLPLSYLSYATIHYSILMSMESLIGEGDIDFSYTRSDDLTDCRDFKVTLQKSKNFTFRIDQGCKTITHPCLSHDAVSQLPIRFVIKPFESEDSDESYVIQITEKDTDWDILLKLCIVFHNIDLPQSSNTQL